MNDKIQFVSKVNTTVQKITKRHMHTYYPDNRTYLNTPLKSTIINVPCENAVYDTADSNIVICGKIVGVGAELTGDQHKLIKFVRNGYLHLFDQIKYKISNKHVQTVEKPGYSILMKGLATFTRNNMLEGWDDTLVTKDGKFSISIPLKHIFSIFETYNKVIISVAQSIDFQRSVNDANCLLVPDELKNSVKIEITEITLELPHLDLIPEEQIKINKIIESSTYVTIPYLEWNYECLPVITPSNTKYEWNIKTTSKRPLYAIFAFQTAKEDDITKDNSQFDFCNLENLKVMLNTTQYPEEDMNLNVNENNYSIAYNMYTNLKTFYYPNINPMLLNHIVSKVEFRDKYPLFIIAMTPYDEVVKDTSINIRARFAFRIAPPPNTAIHAAIVSESYFGYNPSNDLIKKDV